MRIPVLVTDINQKPYIEADEPFGIDDETRAAIARDNAEREQEENERKEAVDYAHSANR